MITANFSEWHKAKLQEFLNETTPDVNDLRTIAQELKVLPLMLDWGGCFALQANGEIVSFLWDDERNVRQEKDARIRNLALFQGSKKYPELIALIPARSPEARTCPVCDGTGVAPIAVELKLDNLVCGCGGLGWIPPES